MYPELREPPHLVLRRAVGERGAHGPVDRDVVRLGVVALKRDIDGAVVDDLFAGFDAHLRLPKEPR